MAMIKKFRARAKIGGAFVYGYFTTNASEDLWFINSIKNNQLSVNEIDPKTVGLCFDGKDINSHEIYQGDIVIADALVFVVTFGDYEKDGRDHKGWYLKSVQDSDFVTPLSSFDSHYLEVVGNIHENVLDQVIYTGRKLG